MIQTLALLHAAYRELNARKLFWVTLGLSLLVVAAMAIVGINEKGMTLLWWQFDLAFLNTNIMPVDVFYKLIFSQLAVPYWLAWIATILALISTASIFPDMVSGGSIDILLSKPIGRARLFLTRYLTGLLFVLLQVSVFTIAAFLVIGFRGGAWEPWILISIPLVLLFYSYLFSVCALLGTITKSTIASFLITMLFWLLVFGVNSGEQITLAGRTALEISLGYSQEDLKEAVDAGDPIEVTEPLQMMCDDDQRRLDTWKSWNLAFFSAKTFLPKTDETIDLLERILRERTGMQVGGPSERLDTMFGSSQQISNREFAEKMQGTLDDRSITWIIGTSLLFEFFVLGLVCWYFSRRDF